MTDIAIRVEDLSKQYSIGTANSPSYHRLSEAFCGLPKMVWRASKSLISNHYRPQAAADPSSMSAAKFWALKDVNLEVRRGEVVGIVGRNGAGKSTLLKILSRITEPTTGRFGLRGRVASLLEVGTGFHPELTGRENIYVSGTILGMTRAEIKRRFDEIVEFSGVASFLDSPVKHYSSGMQVRLGFAVAAHLESEILIIDEVLAVGDAEFQKKCLGKVGDVSKHGRTVLFVSHNILAVKSLCHRAILLKAGTVEISGQPAEVCQAYLETNSASRGGFVANPADKVNGPQLLFCRALNGSMENYRFSRNDTVQLDIAVGRSDFHDNSHSISLHVYFGDETLAFATASSRFAAMQEEEQLAGVCQWSCRIPPHLLNEGRYSVEVLIVSPESRVIQKVWEAVCFEVFDEELRSGWFGTWPGVVRPKCLWNSPTVYELVGEHVDASNDSTHCTPIDE